MKGIIKMNRYTGDVARGMKGVVKLFEVRDAAPSDGGVKYGSGRMRDALSAAEYSPLDTTESVFDDLAWEFLREETAMVFA